MIIISITGMDYPRGLLINNKFLFYKIIFNLIFSGFNSRLLLKSKIFILSFNLIKYLFFVTLLLTTIFFSLINF